MTSIIEALEQEYAMNRNELLSEEGVSTPMSVLRELAHGYANPVHMEFHEVHISKYTRAYQVEMYVGRVKGTGQAPRRKLAMQVAAADVLNKIANQGFEISPYGMVPGSRINPAIFGELAALCQVMKLSEPFYVELAIDPEAEDLEYLFMYKCQIGQLINIGWSDSRFVAKRWAAKKAFEALTGEIVPLDEVKNGAACDLLEKYQIIPQNSQKKIEILKYRDECRKKEARSPGAGAKGGRNLEDDFGDEGEVNIDDNNNAAAKERVGALKVEDIRVRLRDLSIRRQETDGRF